MAGVEVASAYVSLIPSLKGLQRELAKIHDVQVDIDANTAGIREKIEAATSGITGNVKVEIHKSAWQQLKMLSSALKTVSVGTAGTITKLGLLSATAGTAVSAVHGLATTVASASGALLVLPGAAAAGATAFGALKIGLMGVGDSMKALASGDAQKFNQSLAKLSPNARSTMMAFKGLSGAATSLKNSVQDSLFAGMSTQVKTLGATYIPLLKTGLSGTATQLNGMARSMTSFLMSSKATGAVSTIMGNTNKTLAAMRPALTNVVAGFLDIANVGSGFLPQLGAGITNLTAKFRTWAAQAAASGRLQQMISTGFKTLAQIGRVVANVAGTVVNVFHAMGGAAGGLFGNLGKATAAMRSWTGSAQGQKQLGIVFGALQRSAAVLAPVMGQVARTVGQLLVQIAPLLPQVAQLAGQFISALLPVLRQVIPILLQAAMSVMPPLISAFKILAPVIVQVAGFVAQLLRAVAPLIPPLMQIASVVLTALMAALRPLIPPFVQLAQAILPPLMAVAQALSPVLALMGQLLASLARAVMPLVTWLANLISSIARSGVVMGIFKAAVAVVKVVLGVLGTEVRIIIGVFRALGTVAKAIGHAVATVWRSMKAVVASAASGIKAVGTAVGKAWSWLIRQGVALKNRVVAAFRSIVSGGRSLWNSFTGWLKSLVSRVVGRVASLWSSLGRSISRVWRSISSGARSAWNGLVSFVRGIPSRISGIFRNAGRWLVGAGRAIINGFKNGIAAAFRGAKNLVHKGLHAIRRLFPFSPAKEGPFAGSGYTTYSGQALITDWGKGIKSVIPHATQAADTAMQQVHDALTAQVSPDITPTVSSAATVAANATVGLSGQVRPAGAVVTIDASNLDRALLEWLRRAVRTQGGGSVQKALGK